jgi:replicative DNA helicase
VNRDLAEDFARVPPHDRGAERIVCGAVMLSKDALADVTREIRAEDLFVPAHQLVFEAVLALDEMGAPHDPIAVADRLRDTGFLTKAGGGPYLHTLVESVPSSANAGYYARLVREKAGERAVIEAGMRLIQIGWEPGLEPEAKLDRAWGQLEAATAAVSGPRGVALAERLPAALDRIEAGPPPGLVRSPWQDLDALTGGAQPGQLITIGARPSVGKSVVLSNWAVHAALAGVPVLFYSLEMSETECLARILAAAAAVDLAALHGDRPLSDAEWERLAKAQAVLSDAPLLISDVATLRTGDIREDLRRARRAGDPAGLVVIDYAQLMTSAARRDNRYDNRQAEVAEITGTLKAAAKEHATTVLVGAQLNRGSEMRSDHRPLLADLRDSGSFEQDSDVVALLFREEIYDEASPRAGMMDVIVAKNRSGPTGTVTLDFRGAQARVEDHPWSASDAVVADELAQQRRRHALRSGRPDPD